MTDELIDDEALRLAELIAALPEAHRQTLWRLLAVLVAEAQRPASAR